MATPVVRGNSLYTIVDGPSWTQAEANSVKLGGHLATINDANENTWLSSTFKSDMERGYAWIGYTDRAEEGRWIWASGETSNYSNFVQGAPNNFTGYYPTYGGNLVRDSNGEDYAATGTNAVWQDYAPNHRDVSSGGIAEIPFVQRGDSAYVIVEGATWREAEANAVKLGGHLVTINDAAENNFINSTVKDLIWSKYGRYGEKTRNGSYTNHPFIGYTDSEQEGVWKWISGEASTYTNWAPGEPSGGNPQSAYYNPNEDYAAIYLIGDINSGSEGKWNDAGEGGQIGIAEIKLSSSPPTPTYSLSTSTNALGEGESFSTTVSTTNVAAGTSLFYALSGTGITAADFTAGGLSGTGTVGSDGKFTFSKTLASDLTTEGTETLTVRLYTDNNLTQQVGNAPNVTIYDISTTPQAAINVNGNNNGVANTGTINNSGTINTGTVNTNSGNTTNITNNNIDKSKTTTISPTTINNITNNTTNNIAVNAVITNTSAPTYNVSNTYAKNLIGDVLTGSPQLTQNSYDAKFYNLGGGRYGVQQKGKSTIDEITGASNLQFQDQALSLTSDVAATFNQVKGIDDVSGVVFRLYNAAFARLPDAKGLENWINGNQSGGQTYSSSALEFAKSQEFKNRYGSNVSDTQYVNTLYNNVLGRTADAGGLAHYQGLLASGKDRGSLLLDFSESPENRVLFTKTTGLS